MRAVAFLNDMPRKMLLPMSKNSEEIFMPNPFVHIELMANDVAKAKSFYGKLLNWKLEDAPIPGMDYTMIRVGEGTGGGMMKNPMPGGGSVWVPYVDVDDLRAATDKAKSLGGKVHKDSVDIDFGIFSIVEDPTGAMIGLWKQKKK
jgi:predicted enzyme related to lactoylglutathione lyase